MDENEVLESLSKERIRWVKLQFLDVRGKLRQITVNATDVSSKTFEEGIEAEIGSMFNDDENTYLLLRPIADSYAIIPWEDSTARLFCSVYTLDGQPYEKDTSHFVNKVMSHYLGNNFQEVMISPTYEFTILESATVDKLNPERGPTANVDTREGYWNPSALSYDKTWKAQTMPQDTYSLIRSQIADNLLMFFRYVTKTFSHGEGIGRQRFTLGELDPLSAALSGVVMKYAARNIALLNGAIATFMPYPIHKQPPAKMKFRIKLLKQGKNAFYSPDGKYNASETARRFMAGIIAHAPSLTLFTNPTTNSYRGLFNFPPHNAWSVKISNTTVSLIPGNDVAVEVSLPDSSANPFLALSAVLAAGLDGIKRRTSYEELKGLPELMSERERKKCLGEELPYNLYSAISAFEKDKDYIKGVLPPAFLSEYLAMKLEEYREDLGLPTAFDYREYFNV